MKKSILKLGKSLAKKEQKSINGGFGTVKLTDRCFCLLQNRLGEFYAQTVDCYSTCPNGSDPLQY